jgi:nucleotide-binding universal stress UspA family protein
MRLLVAIDGTDASEGALDYALEMASRLDASLLLAFVIEPAVRVTTEEGSTQRLDGTEPIDTDADDDEADTQFVREALEDARTTGDRLLHEAATRANAAGVDADTRIVTGDPVETLLRLAVEASTDGIVVGHRSTANHADDVGGSVAKALIERSSVPVTVVT